MRGKSLVLGFVLAGVACGGDDTSGGAAGSTAQTAGSITPGSGGSSGTSSTAGTGGSSAAGSSMTGGASGASAAGAGGGMAGGAGGAASKCTVLNQNACDTCVFGKCCDAYAACNKDDDCQTGMGHLAECVAADTSMATQCYDDFATTNDLALALRMCVKTSCDSPCATATP